MICADGFGKEEQLVVPLVLNSIENSGLSVWLRESDSPFGFYFILALHTIGMAMLVGPNAAIDLRLLGVAREIPIAPMKKWFKIMWLGFAINTATGIFLLIAYPTKAFTNIEFYVKLLLIGLAVCAMQRLKTQVFGDMSLSDATKEAKGRTLATWSLTLWMGAILAGRLLAYTYIYIRFGHYAPGG